MPSNTASRAFSPATSRNSKGITGWKEIRRWSRPSWAHILIDALNSPGVSWLLLLIGGAALYAELQSPRHWPGRFDLGPLLHAVFLDRLPGGPAGWLEVLLFLAGIVCLMLEVFVLPGVGVFGLAGGLLVIVSLVLASQTFVLPRNAYQVSAVAQQPACCSPRPAPESLPWRC